MYGTEQNDFIIAGTVFSVLKEKCSHLKRKFGIFSIKRMVSAKKCDPNKEPKLAGSMVTLNEYSERAVSPPPGVVHHPHTDVYFKAIA